MPPPVPHPSGNQRLDRRNGRIPIRDTMIIIYRTQVQWNMTRRQERTTGWRRHSVGFVSRFGVLDEIVVKKKKNRVGASCSPDVFLSYLTRLRTDFYQKSSTDDEFENLKKKKIEFPRRRAIVAAMPCFWAGNKDVWPLSSEKLKRKQIIVIIRHLSLPDVPPCSLSSSTTFFLYSTVLKPDFCILLLNWTDT